MRGVLRVFFNVMVETALCVRASLATVEPEELFLAELGGTGASLLEDERPRVLMLGAFLETRTAVPPRTEVAGRVGLSGE